MPALKIKKPLQNTRPSPEGRMKVTKLHPVKIYGVEMIDMDGEEKRLIVAMINENAHALTVSTAKLRPWVAAQIKEISGEKG
jgi:hypothetical protein